MTKDEVERTFGVGTELCKFVGIKNMNVTGNDSKLAEGVLETRDGEDGYEVDYRFIGTYNTGLDKKVIPYGYYSLSRITKGEKAKAYYRETSRNQNRTTGLWKANTCCVIPPSIYAQSAKSMFNIWSSELEGSDNQPTGISSALVGEKTDVKMGNVYTLQGQYVGKAENLSGLASGIYVVNGKKYVVK